MAAIQFDYSTKNIPIPSEKEFITKLIEMTEKLCVRVRWKAFFFLNPDCNPSRKETYGFKTLQTPTNIPQLYKFERRLKELIQKIKFKPVNSRFLEQLATDIHDNIKSTAELLVPADKTTNFYKITPDKYAELLRTNITTDYKKTDDETTKSITDHSKNIIKTLELDDRVMQTANKQAFITMKDHKTNFDNKPSCRLINPTKPEIGRISKQILDRINTETLKHSKLNLWKSTDAVLKWFNNADINHRYISFIVFDIVNFYPSISKELLSKALTFAQQYSSISDLDKEIIMQAKASFLINDDQAWSKKATNRFDVTMGSFDGAETCELVGTFILHIINTSVNGQYGLYRDDGLGIIKATPRQVENTKKKICDIFNTLGLNITIEANLKIVNYLDVNLNLNTGKHSPYMKVNNNLKYVHSCSNHPPSITRNIPASINRRLSTISSNRETFEKAKPPYQQALAKSGYLQTLNYDPPAKKSTPSKRNRKRNIIWYNPPFSRNVATNIGKEFLKILREEFPQHNELHKILNPNTVKISYSCMPNISNIIKQHNSKILHQQKAKPAEKKCNCRITAECPLSGECQTSSVIYQATVTETKDKKQQTYIGLTETTFKKRHANHKASFKDRNKRTQTELSNHVWKLKDQQIDYTIKWKIITKAKAFNTTRNYCGLCTAEKFYILHLPKMASLNGRDGIVSSCRHKAKHLLNNAP